MKILRSCTYEDLKLKLIGGGGGAPLTCPWTLEPRQWRQGNVVIAWQRSAVN